MKKKKYQIGGTHRKLLQYIKEWAFPMLFKLSYVNGEKENVSNYFRKIQKL